MNAATYTKAGAKAASPAKLDKKIFGVEVTDHSLLKQAYLAELAGRRANFAKAIDKAVFPGFQGGPHMNNVAAKAVAFGEALKPEFNTYAEQVIKNAKKLADELIARGGKLITGGTSNHLMLVDSVSSWNVPGKQAQSILDSVGITLNMNMIADDPRSPLDPSGIRLGTPAITTRGAKEEDMTKIADWMVRTLQNPEDTSLHEQIKEEVRKFSMQFPVPGVE